MSRLVEPKTPSQALAVTISEMNTAATSHILGVVLTMIDASMPASEQAESLKSLIRREIYNDQRNRIALIHSIISRADINNFREHPTLEEQSAQPDLDSTIFEKYE